MTAGASLPDDVAAWPSCIIGHALPHDRHRRQVPGRRHCRFAARDRSHHHGVRPSSGRRRGHRPRVRAEGSPGADPRGDRSRRGRGHRRRRRRHHARHRAPARAVQRAADRHQPGATRLHDRHPARLDGRGARRDAGRPLRDRGAHVADRQRPSCRRGRLVVRGLHGARTQRHRGLAGRGLRHGRTDRRRRRPLHVQPAVGRTDRRDAHRFDRVLAVRQRPADAPGSPRSC